MYSQHDEEKCILENTSLTGRLLDLGAWSGSVFSNSLALIERGWSAVLVEPSPGPFLELTKLHKANEKVTLINALVGLHNYGLKKFYSTEDAISTTDQKNCEKWGGGKNFREIYSSEVPLCAITPFGPFDFCTIDTEGSSVDLLTALDLKALGTNLVCVEHDGRHSEVNDFFIRSGFGIIYQNGTNTIGKRI